MSSRELQEMAKFISPILERNREIERFNQLPIEEKTKIIKEKFNLTHGNSKKQKRKKKKKRG